MSTYSLENVGSITQSGILTRSIAYNPAGWVIAVTLNGGVRVFTWNGTSWTYKTSHSGDAFDWKEMSGAVAGYIHNATGNALGLKAFQLSGSTPTFTLRASYVPGYFVVDVATDTNNYVYICGRGGLYNGYVAVLLFNGTSYTLKDSYTNTNGYYRCISVQGQYVFAAGDRSTDNTYLVDVYTFNGTSLTRVARTTYPSDTGQTINDICYDGTYIYTADLKPNVAGNSYLKSWSIVGSSVQYLGQEAIRLNAKSNPWVCCDSQYVYTSVTDWNVVPLENTKTYSFNGSVFTLRGSSTPSMAICNGPSIGSLFGSASMIAYNVQHITANFTSNVIYGPANLACTFTNNSSTAFPPVTYLWDFGDGATSTSQNPSHTYTVAGYYTVTLTVSDAHGTTDTVTKSNYINVLMNANFTSNVTSGNSPLLINFSDTTQGTPTAWDWDFGDGSLHATTQSPSHTYTTTSNYHTVTLIATRGTASDTEVKTNYIHTIPVAVSITSQPETLLPVNIGETVTFHTTATGTKPLSYQWYVNSGIIGGANASSYTIPPATAPMDGDAYQCVVSNIVGPVTSNNGVLNVIVLPVIVDEPEDVVLHVGELALFQVNATSPTYETYQWFFDGAPVGTNSNIYTRTAAAPDNGKRVWCQIINDDGMTETRHALITVLAVLEITTQPRTRVVLDGTTATYSITASGTGVGYQWFRDNVLIPGATSSSYTTSVVTTIDNNGDTYKCVINDSISQLESDTAWLQVYEIHTECGLGYGTSRYAINKYKVCVGIAYTKLHYYALKKTFPMPQMEGVLNDDLNIEGFYLDNCYYEAGGKSPADATNAPKGLHAEMFADTAQRLLADYERMYNLVSTGSVATRRSRIQAAITAKGGLSVPYFIALAAALGYTITISEGSTLLFRVGTTTPPATPLPHGLYEITAPWTWLVKVTGAYSAPELEALFQRLRPAHTLVTFSYS